MTYMSASSIIPTGRCALIDATSTGREMSLHLCLSLGCLQAFNLLLLGMLAVHLLDLGRLPLPLFHTLYCRISHLLRQLSPPPVAALNADDLGDQMETPVAHEEPTYHGRDHSSPEFNHLIPKPLPQGMASVNPLDGLRSLHDLVTPHAGHLPGQHCAGQSLDSLRCPETPARTLKLDTCNLAARAVHSGPGKPAADVPLNESCSHLATPDALI